MCTMCSMYRRNQTTYCYNFDEFILICWTHIMISPKHLRLFLIWLFEVCHCLSHHSVRIINAFKPPFNIIEIPRSTHTRHLSHYQESVSGVGCLLIFRGVIVKQTLLTHHGIEVIYLCLHFDLRFFLLRISLDKFGQYSSMKLLYIQFIDYERWNHQFLSAWGHMLNFKLLE